MSTYPSTPYPEEAVEWCADTIAKTFAVPSDRARALAIQAMDAMDSKGGDPLNQNDMKQVIDVVVRSWIQAEEL